MKKKFDVVGMTCAVCQRTIEKDVSKIKGIKKVEVSLLSNTMIVEYDEQNCTPATIMKQVKKSGYTASVYQGDKADEDTSGMKRRLILSLIFLIPLLFISMGPMIGIALPSMIESNYTLYALIQLLLVMPIVIVNRSFFIRGFLHLIHGTPNMDTLVAIGSLASLTYSLIGAIEIWYYEFTSNQLMAHESMMKLYFEAAASILTLVTLGKYLEALSKRKTKTELEKLVNLQPQTALLLHEEKITPISVSKIQIGNRLLVRPGSQIPMDGIIINGHTSIDESMISGESIPVDKLLGDTVICATLNLSGSIEIEATKTSQNSTINQMIQMVEKASMSKAPIQKLADRISFFFVPAVILISLVSFASWYLLGYTFSFSLSMGITVLVISCPCALGLATPVAMIVGSGKGAEKGILFKDAEAIQKLSKVDTVILDKTGTITLGMPAVTDNIVLNKRNNLQQLVCSIEIKSNHPLAKAIVAYHEKQGVVPSELQNVEEAPGYGMIALIQNEKIYIGNERWLIDKKITYHQHHGLILSLKEKGKTLVYVFSDTAILSIYALQDTVKEGSKIAISAMKKKNLNIIMLTGDHEQSALFWKDELSINTTFSNVLPQDKSRIVDEYIAEGKNVAMVGDGINDSIALASSTVGISFGSGTDIAKSAADVILMNEDLTNVDYALELSKKTMKNVKQNLFFAFFYNILLIPLAAGIYYLPFGIALNPIYGSLAMSMSSVTVVLNALRLKKFKQRRG